MSFFGTCPQCSTEIPKDRYVSGFAICECGWCDTTGIRRSRKADDKKAVRGLIAGAVVLVALFAHLTTWGSYSVEIPIVKLRQITGTLSKQGYLELADACLSLGRFECAKTAYGEIYTRIGDVSGLAMKASLEEKLGQTQNATSTLASYFSAGGKDAMASVAYGRMLEAAGKTDDAFKYFESAVANSGELLPVQATTGIVRLLMKQGRYEEALERIQTFHQSAGNAIGYLNTELSQLESYLGTQAKSSKQPKSKKPTGKKVARI